MDRASSLLDLRFSISISFRNIAQRLAPIYSTELYKAFEQSLNSTFHIPLYLLSVAPIQSNYVITHSCRYELTLFLNIPFSQPNNLQSLIT